ncbi:MAG: NAD-dependent epimerase/dehydratase family protein [Bacteroidales bacterium]|nr:NAD-dependent epimerase/dehydratase family protein [Bacteroidales bacterium]
MKILVTGAAGFVGKNLCASLKNIRDGKDKTRPFCISEIFEYDIASPQELLEEACQKADFVFNLAGVNRPTDPADFQKGNFGFASSLLDTLEKYGNKAPVMLSSSQQASLCGRFGNSEYGRSKKAGEDLFLEYARRCGARVLIYRFPNIFGKWCRPSYNSAIATFCHNLANGLPIQVNDPSVEMEVLYIDDLVEEMMRALQGKENRCDFVGMDCQPNENGPYCYCPITHHCTLGEIVQMIENCRDFSQNMTVPEIPAGSLQKKLFSTYLSYLPADKAIEPLNMNIDARGSFTEMLHSKNVGQVSINISKPGITKGEHWHHSKWELFIVVKGEGLIQMRHETQPDAPILEYRVSGEKIEAVYMLPGYTHNIINLSDTEDLVTVMWANESFDPAHPDTFYDPVNQ